MKNFIKSIRLTLVFCLFFSVFYILILWIFAQFAGPNSGNAEVATLDGKIVGAANVGQVFTEDIYFWGRPSCAGDGYDASSSAGSNKGPTNEEYLAEVETRIDTFLVHHPYLERKDVPAEMVTASGSGLDPDITPESAYVQVKRVAAARNMDETTVKEIVDQSIDKEGARLIRALIIISIIGLLAMFTNKASAQVRFNVQGDLVSSYVWRGMYQTGASIQPTLSFSVENLSLTAWGSTDFDGYRNGNIPSANKELDLTLAYTFPKLGLTVSVADMWQAGQGAGKYFDFNNKTTAHHFEASLAYVLPVEKFPLSIAWYTMFAGMDKNEKGDKNNYSSYVELNYPFSVKSVDLNVTCGIVPYKAPQYYTNGFAVTNVALKGSYAIKITDSFSLPIFSQVIWNPRMEDAHIVFGITLKP